MPSPWTRRRALRRCGLAVGMAIAGCATSEPRDDGTTERPLSATTTAERQTTPATGRAATAPTPSPTATLSPTDRRTPVEGFVEYQSCGASASVQGRNRDAWLMLDHDPGSGGRNPQATLPAEPPEPEWDVDLDIDDAVPTAPTIGHRVFVGTETYENARYTATVHALDKLTGDERWSVELAYERTSQPTFDPRTEQLYVLSGQDNSNTGPGKGEVLALDPETGDERWRFTAPRRFSGGPIVVDGTVIATNDSHGKAAVHALDAENGEELWRFETGSVLHNTPTVVSETVYVSRNRDELCALALEDGSLRWRVSTKADDTRPVVGAERVFVGYPRGLEAFCRDTGDLAWRWTVSDEDTEHSELRGVYKGPLVAGDRLYVQTSDTSPHDTGDTDRLYAMDLETGTFGWAVELGSEPYYRGRDVIGVGDGVLAVRVREEGRDLLAIDHDGTIEWTLPDVGSPMAASANRLLAFGSSKLYSYSLLGE